MVGLLSQIDTPVVNVIHRDSVWDYMRFNRDIVEEFIMQEVSEDTLERWLIRKTSRETTNEGLFYTYHMHTTCIPHAYHMHTPYIPHAYHMHTTCIPHAYHIIPHAYHMHIIFHNSNDTLFISKMPNHIYHAIVAYLI